MKFRIALAALAGAAALAAAGAAATAPSAGASTVPATTTVSHITYPSPPRGYAGWQLAATLTRGYQTWGNHRELVLTLTNTSQWPVSLAGYPGLQLLTSKYQPLPTTTVPVTVRYPWANSIVLRPGQSATADITFTVYQMVYPWKHYGPPYFMPSAAYLVVTLPGSHQGHYQGYGQHFLLKMPGGPVRILQDKLYETPLMGQSPIYW
jgi:hypothetical protein